MSWWQHLMVVKWNNSLVGVFNAEEEEDIKRILWGFYKIGRCRM